MKFQRAPKRLQTDETFVPAERRIKWEGNFVSTRWQRARRFSKTRLKSRTIGEPDQFDFDDRAGIAPRASANPTPRGSVVVVRASINVTGGALIDDIIIIMHDYVAGADRARQRHQVVDFGDILPPTTSVHAY